jgi:hypothetical protein
MDFNPKDLAIQKKMYTIAFIWAGIILEIIRLNFRFNIPVKYLPPISIEEQNKMKSEGDISAYKIPILKFISETDPELFQAIQLKKLKITQILTSAFNELKKYQIKKDISAFEQVRELYGVKSIPYILFDVDQLDPADREKEIKKIQKELSHVKVNKSVFQNAFMERLYIGRNLIKISFNNVAWENLANLFDNKKINKLFLKGSVIPVSQVFENIPLRQLNVSDQKLDSVYNYVEYTKDGKKQKWDITIFQGDGEAKTKDIKEKIKIQKEMYDFGLFDGTEPFRYIQFSDSGINILNINEFSRDYKNTNNKDIKSKNKDIKLNKSQTQELRNKVIYKAEEDKIKEQLIRACAGLTGHIVEFTKDVEFMCGIDEINEDLINKILKEIEKKEKSKELTIQKYVPPELKSYKVDKNLLDKFPTVIDEKRMAKLSSEFGSKDALDFLNIGVFPEHQEEKRMELESKTFILTPDERQKEERRIKREQGLARIQILINVLTRLYMNYMVIKYSSTDVFLNSTSLVYLAKYINNKNPEDFNEDIPHLIDYENVLYDPSISISDKINILLNVLMEMMIIMIKTKSSLSFIIEFLKIIQDENKIIDITHNKLQKLEYQQDMIKQKRFDILLKKAPEEKVAQGFMQMNLEEQIEFLDEEKIDNINEVDNALINSYNPAEEFEKEDQDIESIDDADYDVGDFDLL